MCFLDISKAFHHVNHGKLLKKLSEAGVPKYTIRILSYWYAHQTLQVKWDDWVSASFQVSNGVRQGSILSPFFFQLLYKWSFKRAEEV